MGELAGGEDLSGKWVVPHTPHSLGHCPRAETLSHGQQFVVSELLVCSQQEAVALRGHGFGFPGASLSCPDLGLTQ